MLDFRLTYMNHVCPKTEIRDVLPDLFRDVQWRTVYQPGLSHGD